jgi:diguanylate cyclase (GGDEF)-like protein
MIGNLRHVRAQGEVSEVMNTRQLRHLFHGSPVRWLTILSLIVSACTLAFGGAILLDMRKDARTQAETAAGNLVTTLSNEIARNFHLYDLSVEGAINAWDRYDIHQISPETRQMALFDHAAKADYLGLISITDPFGTVIASSVQAAIGLSIKDRKHFVVQRDRVDAGTYVSRPFRSQLFHRDATIAISRRIFGHDGSFGGIAVGTVRLAFFRQLFEKLNLGPSGTVAVLRNDGHLIIRSPFNESDFDRDFSASPVFRSIRKAPAGSFIEVATSDGIQRLFSYRQIDDLPLIVIVAIATSDIYAAWRPKAVAVGLAVTILCGAATVLLFFFRKEILLRIAAEEKLKLVADTDGLTEIANRRSFDRALTEEWRRAIRNQMPIALLLMDADFFKLFNDTYGHQAGDHALCVVAQAITKNMRRSADLAGRYGGEEFVALLPDTEMAGALKVAENIRATITGLDVPHSGSRFGCLTLSIGVAVLHPAFASAESSLVKMADKALYEAKQAGRNRICTQAEAEIVELEWVSPEHG